MTRFIAATAIALIAATSGAALAQDVTRNEPAALLVSPIDLAVQPADQATVTVGGAAEAAAETVLTARDRALLGLEAGDTVRVSVFETTGQPVSLR